MSATIHQIAPTAARSVTPAADAGSLVANSGGASSPRSAQPNHDHCFNRAVKTMADHGRIVATSAADGDKKRQARLLIEQGEILMAAGMQLIQEGGAA